MSSEELSMRTYVLVATVFFDLLTVVQLVRLFLRWPVFVAGVSIPLWVSGVAALIVGSLEIAGMLVLVRNRVPRAAVYRGVEAAGAIVKEAIAVERPFTSR